MKPVSTSLLPLFTCPAFMLWHLLGAVVCIPAFLYACSSADPETGGLVAGFILPLWSAIVLTSLQKDLLVVPANFCLPGHRAGLRRTSFLVGIVTSFLASLPVLNYPGLDGLQLAGAMCSAFSFALILYLLVVRLLLLVDSGMILLGPSIVAGALLIELTSARVFVQTVALFSPIWNTLVLAAIGLVTWKWMGSIELARRICDSRFLSLQMAWRRSAGEQFAASGKREYLSKGTWWVRTWLLQHLFSRIRHRPAFTFRRNLAASQYVMAGRLVPVRGLGTIVTLLAVLVLLVVAGYSPVWKGHPDVPAANVIYIVSCLLGLHLGFPLFNTMLLPAGRTERFRNSLAMGICGTVIVLVAMVLMYGLLLVADQFAPSLSFRGTVHEFRPANLAPAFVPFAMLPISFVLKLECKKWLVVPEILLFLTAIMFITRGGIVLSNLSLPAMLTFVLAGWAVFAGVVYARCFYGDLIRE